ncbi:MAG: phosphodiester glycosidase family protein [Bacilli bacterium]|nr:phosphodiester glycosidase family protein [Bacilli bacterium]
MLKNKKKEIEVLELNEEDTKKKRKMRLKISKFTILIILLDIIVLDGLIVINNNEFKAFWIPTAMTTMSHKYLAYTLYNEDTVNKVMSANYIEQNNEEINLDDIVIGDNKEKSHYSSVFEKELFTRMENNEVYKIIRLEESKYKGYLTVIYDPSDVELAVSSKLGKAGQSVNNLVKENNGLVGINGGGFEDLDGWGNGSIPYGAIIKDGQLIWQHSGGSGQLIGFTKDHKMNLTSKAPAEAIAEGMMDAVEFGPNLIVNGKVSKIHGDGGWGTAPRSVIAQRKDGIVLFLIIEGRLPGYSTGATMNDVIDILLRYKAYNAANLDGGASSTMSVEGKLWNKPSAGESYGGRTVSNAWIVTNKQNKPAQAPVKSK